MALTSCKQGLNRLLRGVIVAFLFISLFRRKSFVSLEASGSAGDAGETRSGDSSKTLGRTAPPLSADDQKKPARSLTVDILSVGSVTRPDYQETQKETFGAHPAVRHFFRVAEKDDSDRGCSEILQLTDVEGIVQFCRSKRLGKARRGQLSHFQKMRKNYATFRWLKKKQNPVGWMCAQKRPVDGLVSVLHSYSRSSSLPDYLFVVDDDTFVNLHGVLSVLSSSYPATEAYAVAGCMVRSDRRVFNFTIPFGGFGLVLSRPVLQNFLTPIHCNVGAAAATGGGRVVAEAVCQHVQRNEIGEQSLFQEGMTVADLMHHYVTAHSYQHYRNWTLPGYCFHSDWAMGYFINFYHMARHTTDDPLYQDVPQDRLHAYRGSQVGPGPDGKIAKLGECRHNNRPEQGGGPCTAEAHFCHYATPQQMKELYHQQAGTT
jgi:hypothetical protein